MGYAGGDLLEPTYHNLATHAEAIQLDYDPSILSYESMLELFFQSHRPVGGMRSTQYRSAIFCENDAEIAVAERAKYQMEADWQTPVSTEIAQGRTFWMAEDYHQKYRLQHTPRLMKGLQTLYPDFWDLVASPTAMRLNALAAGKLPPELMKEELADYGLSEALMKTIRGDE